MKKVDPFVPDLNLLPILETLVTERSVSRAAAKLHITQPAVSYALGKLRRQFDDPLLVKTRNGMNPTPRALQLMGPIRSALDELRQAMMLSPDFVPEAANTVVKIGVAEYAGHVILRDLLAVLATEAPALKFNVRLIGHESADISEAGHTCDLVLSLGEGAPSRFRHREVMRDRVVVVQYSPEPVTAQRLSLEQIARQPRIVQTPWSPDVREVMEPQMRKLEPGLPAITLPHTFFSAVPLTLGKFNSLHPRRMAERYATGPGFHILELDAVVPDVIITMLWHRRHDDSAMHAWLREKTIAVCDAIVNTKKRPASKRRAR